MNLLNKLEQKFQELENHPIYESIDSSKKLAVFMESHVYCVWDFMSLLKSLQSSIAPTGFPWLPNKESDLVRLINDIVVGEESDENHDGKFMSHFEMYLLAMREVGANTEPIIHFLTDVHDKGLEAAFDSPIPSESLKFTRKTFEFTSKEPHIVAAAFALGREHVIPLMFKKVLEKFSIKKEDAPTFHYYLDRHIELDGDHHGPMSMKMLDVLCGGDDSKLAEVEAAAFEAIDARILFWDELLVRLNQIESVVVKHCNKSYQIHTHV